jgi:hypothetical protein
MNPKTIAAERAAEIVPGVFSNPGAGPIGHGTLSEDARLNMHALDHKAQALRNWEEACNVMAIVFGDEPETSPSADLGTLGPQDVRRIVLTARGDVREALGEGRS